MGQSQNNVSSARIINSPHYFPFKPFHISTNNVLSLSDDTSRHFCLQIQITSKVMSRYFKKRNSI